MHRCDLCSSIDIRDDDVQTYSPPDTCDACREFTLLNRQILESQAALEALLYRRREVKSKLNNVHGSIVHRMPKEVVSSIFVYATVANSPADGVGLKGLATFRKLPLTLGAVCQTWRKIAWSTSEIWASLRMGLSPRTSASQVDLAKEWLNRSANQPLSIDLSWRHHDGSAVISPHLSSMIDTVNQCSDRWHSLCLYLPARLLERLSDQVNPSSILHELKLRGMPDDNRIGIVHAAPKIVNYSGFRFRSLPFNWSKLIDLTVSTYYLNDVWDILREAPQLTKCTLRISYANENTSENYEERRTGWHAGLKVLDVDFERSSDLPARFFRTLNSPALLDLTVGQLGYRLLSHSLSFFLNRCSLMKLTLREADVFGKDLDEILQKTPTLSSLDFSGINVDVLSSFALSLSAHLPHSDNQTTTLSSPLVPGLKSFAMTSGCPNFSQLIEGLFSPLSRQINAPRRPLEVVHIFCRGEKGDPIPYLDRTVLEKIANLEREGVKFRIDFWVIDAAPRDLIALSLAQDKEPR